MCVIVELCFKRDEIFWYAVFDLYFLRKERISSFDRIEGDEGWSERSFDIIDWVWAVTKDNIFCFDAIEDVT